MGVEWGTFWSAVSAIATVAGARAICLAVRQLRFEAWLKAQEVFTGDDFTRARGRVFARLDDRDQPWTDDEKSNGLQVCRKMDELARLGPYLSKKTILRTWGDPLAKAWLLLEPVVREERQKSKWDDKWDAFEGLGKEALRSRPHLLRPTAAANVAPSSYEASSR